MLPSRICCPDPFAYAERYDDTLGTYQGLVIDRAPNAIVVIDGDSVIVKSNVAEAHRPKPKEETSATVTAGNGGAGGMQEGPPGSGGSQPRQQPLQNRSSRASLER